MNFDIKSVDEINKFEDTNKIYLTMLYDNYSNNKGIIKNIDNSKLKDISKYLICNYFELSNEKKLEIQGSELYKLIIPHNIADKVLSGELEFLKDKSGDQLAAIIDTKGRKIVANARLEKAQIPTVQENSNKGINNLVIQNMLVELSRKLDNIDMKLDKLLQIEDDKIESKFTSSLKLYNQAMICENENNRISLLQDTVIKLNEGMDRALKSLKNSMDVISSIPNNSVLRQIIMANPVGKHSKENILRELENIYNKVQLIYMGTGLLSSTYIELKEEKNITNLSMSYLSDMLNYFEDRQIYGFIKNEKTQDVIESSFTMVDAINHSKELIDKKSDLCVEIKGIDLLRLNNGEDI